MNSTEPEFPTTGVQLDARHRDTLLALMSCIVLTGFIAAVAYHYFVGMFGGQLIANVTLSSPEGQAARTYPLVYIGEQYPANTFLFKPWDMFNDFANLYVIFENPDWIQSQPFRWNHFPFAFTMLLPYYYLLPRALGIIVRELLIIVPFLLISRTQLRGASGYDTFRNVVIFSALTYPFLIAVDRANNEADIFLMLCWCTFLIKERNFTWSIVPLSIALAMKPYAAVFLPLLAITKLDSQTFFAALHRERIGAWASMLLGSGIESIAAVSAAALLNLASLPLLSAAVSYNPGVLPEAWKQTIQIYVIGDDGLPFSNSLWAPLKIVLFNVYGSGYQEAVSYAMGPYRTCVLLAFLAICGYAWICEPAFWKRIALFVFSMNLFPYVSADYKLLHAFIPLWLFINKGHRDSLDWPYAVLFALLLVPKNYLRLAAPGMGEANLGVIVNPLIMLSIVLLIMGSGVRSFILKRKACVCPAGLPQP